MTRTSIEWVRNPDGSQGFTVNPIRFRSKETGKVGHYCEKVSPGCKNCYASRMQKGPYLSGLEFIAENKDKGELFFDENVLEQVLRRRKPSTFFWCDCTDLFGPWVPDEWIDRIAATCALTPQHRHLWLTKRAKGMRKYFDGQIRDVKIGAASNRLSFRTRPFTLPSESIFDAHRIAHGESWKIHAWPLPNLGLGVSAEDQKRADERIPDLLATPAAMRFVSVEPMLEAVDVSRFMCPTHWHWEAKYRTPEEALAAGGYAERKRQALVSAYAVFLNWAIVGGESGPGARPMHPEWARSVRDQCQAAGVPFFFKQWGEWELADLSKQMHQHLTTILPVGSTYAFDWEIPFRVKMDRVGKHAAGRLLDGRTYDEMPEMLR